MCQKTKCKIAIPLFCVFQDSKYWKKEGTSLMNYWKKSGAFRRQITSVSIHWENPFLIITINIFCEISIEPFSKFIALILAWTRNWVIALGSEQNNIVWNWLCISEKFRLSFIYFSLAFEKSCSDWNSQRMRAHMLRHRTDSIFTTWNQF